MISQMWWSPSPLVCLGPSLQDSYLSNLRKSLQLRLAVAPSLCFTLHSPIESRVRSDSRTPSSLQWIAILTTMSLWISQRLKFGSRQEIRRSKRITISVSTLFKVKTRLPLVRQEIKLAISLRLSHPKVQGSFAARLRTRVTRTFSTAPSSRMI